jgi:hypothetical protein
MSKQTAVNWLISQILKEGKLIDLDIDAAKKLEREQIEDAYLEGCNNALGIEVALADDVENATNYYRTEYGGQHDPN